VRGLILLLLLVALGVGASFCVVILDEREQAFRTLLSQAEFEVAGVSLNQPELIEPGVYLRIPMLHEFYVYDRRLQRFDSDPQTMLTSDELPLLVDYFLMWRIENPRDFFESNRSVANALARIDDVTYDNVRETLAQNRITALVSPERDSMLARITASCDEELAPHGIRVADLRIRRIDFKEGNIERVFQRMRTDQERVAKRHRAEGEEQARRIRSEADRKSLVLRADALRESELIRGEGDAEATRVYAEAYSEDPEFYSFVRSLEAYRQTIDEGTTFVISPDTPFLRHLFPRNGAASPAR
jgi:membrane protease subunit HflC